RGGKTQIVNTNKMLRSYSGVTGLKTGTTGKAGVCICATAKRNDMSLIAVVLGASSSPERFSAAKKMLDFGFSNFETKQFPDTSAIPKLIKVKYSDVKLAPLSFNLPKKLLFLKGSTTLLTCKVDLPEFIAAPMYEGMKVGNISLYSQNGKIKEYDIVLTQDIDKINLNKAWALLTKSVADM
ncbi:MAG: D-alanyl-D-alanine carboxypeptidase, partial [Oscillospiraceae bacterium]